MTSIGVREPVRPASASESNLLTAARRAGPCVAWRDASGALRLHALGPRTPATIGRAPTGTIVVDSPQVSREHAEITVRVHDAPQAISVHLLDYSRHGTEHRRVTLAAHGIERLAGPWHPVPRAPARAVQLEDGSHDVRLAGEHYLLIDGVPVDEGMTADRDDPVSAPTVRQRQVLVELCRPFFEAPGDIVAPPTNAQIARRLTPVISEDRVSDLMTELYKRYDIRGANAQNRIQLVNFARRHGLVDASDYL